LEKKREDYCTDLEKFSDLIRKLNEHKEASEQKVRDKTAELGRLESELAEADATVKKIRETIASQGITVDDARRLQSEKSRVEDSIAKAATAKQECSKALWELEMDLSRKVGELEAVTVQYNKKGTELQLFPESAKNTHGKKFFIDIEKKYSAEADQSLLLGGVDLNGMVRPHLDALKGSALNRTAEKKQELSQSLDQEDVSEDALTEAADRVKVSVLD